MEKRRSEAEKEAIQDNKWAKKFAEILPTLKKGDQVSVILRFYKTTSPPL